MNLFNDLINNAMELLPLGSGKTTEYSNKNMAANNDKNQLILSSEAAFELGAFGLNSVNMIGMSDNAINKDEVVVYGKDLQEIKKDVNFARITIIKTKNIDTEKEQKTYNALKAIELCKYSLSADGYMVRTSGISNREQVRVSKKAIKKGINFETVGNRFIEQYKTNKFVENVKIIFITLEDFDYEELENIAVIASKRLKALDHMRKDLLMDCKSCEWKVVCDEVEGMKEAHQKMLNI